MHTEKMIIFCYYHFYCKSHALFFPKGVAPTAPKEPTDEVENQIKSPDPRPNAPPDYNSHFVPGRLIEKIFLLYPENNTNS